MSEYKPLYKIAIIFMLGMILLGVFSTIFKSLEGLFNVFLTLWGAAAGFFIESYYSKLSEKQNLGAYSKAGFRLSLDIYDNLKETINLIEQLKSKNQINRNHFEILSEKLKTIQSIALSSNSHWKETLSEEMKQEIVNREKTSTTIYRDNPYIERTEEIKIVNQ